MYGKEPIGVGQQTPDLMVQLEIEPKQGVRHSNVGVPTK